jgi:small-conductance mechanosensitive channel
VQIKSDVNYRIEKLFREAGIQVSSPQVEVRVLGGSIPLELNSDQLPRLNDCE